MRDELEQQLEHDFPFMKRDGSDDIYQKYGCECDNGWYELIHELCQKITDRFACDGKEPSIEVLQVKEKFGGLRFYYKFDKSDVPPVIVDFLGSGTSISLSPNNEDPDNSDNLNNKTEELKKDIRRIVTEYEQKSKTVCEVCGALGEVRTNMPWIRTLCESCHLKRIKTDEETMKKRAADKASKQS